MEKPIKVGIIDNRVAVIEGYFEATTRSYSVERAIIAALTKAGIIEVVDLERQPELESE